MVISPDEYLIVAETGEYVWTLDRVREAWRQTYRAFEAALKYGDFKKVVLLIGIPASGKSSWLRSHEESNTLYVDATFTTRTSRYPFLGWAGEKGIPIVAVVMDTPIAVCLSRNQCRPVNRRVPEDQLTFMAVKLQTEMPTTEEGFAKVIHVTGENKITARSMVPTIRLDLDNPDIMDLYGDTPATLRYLKNLPLTRRYHLGLGPIQMFKERAVAVPGAIVVIHWDGTSQGTESRWQVVTDATVASGLALHVGSDKTEETSMTASERVAARYLAASAPKVIVIDVNKPAPIFQRVWPRILKSYGTGGIADELKKLGLIFASYPWLTATKPQLTLAAALAAGEKWVADYHHRNFPGGMAQVAAVVQWKDGRKSDFEAVLSYYNSPS